MNSEKVLEFVADAPFMNRNERISAFTHYKCLKVVIMNSFVAFEQSKATEEVLAQPREAILRGVFKATAHPGLR